MSSPHKPKALQKQINSVIYGVISLVFNGDFFVDNLVFSTWIFGRRKQNIDLSDFIFENLHIEILKLSGSHGYNGLEDKLCTFRCPSVSSIGRSAKWSVRSCGGHLFVQCIMVHRNQRQCLTRPSQTVITPLQLSLCPRLHHFRALVKCGCAGMRIQT